MGGATLQWLLFRRVQLLMALLIHLVEVLMCQGLVRWLIINFQKRLLAAENLLDTFTQYAQWDVPMLRYQSDGRIVCSQTVCERAETCVLAC